MTKINIDKVVEQHLKKRNMTLEYVPDDGEIVYLRENDNLSTGGVELMLLMRCMSKTKN